MLFYLLIRKMILQAKAIVRMMQYPAESRIVSLTASSAPLNFIRFIVLFLLLSFMKLAPIEAAPPTLVSLPPAAAPPIRAMVAAVVTIDTVSK